MKVTRHIWLTKANDVSYIPHPRTVQQIMC